MLSKSILLNHYKRKDIQQAIIENAQGREVGIRYGDRFGPRPDILTKPQDVLECAKQGATSFHVSEEHWNDPLKLSPNLPQHEIRKLKSGWDFVIDVDCPVWEYSKLITQSIIDVLYEHGVTSVSCKFSGNKGFHIGIPFEAFPSKVGGKETPLLFPEGVRIIASYVISQVDKDNRFTDKILEEGINTLLANLGKEKQELIKTYCNKCNTEIKSTKPKIEYQCPSCQKRLVEEEDVLVKKCPACSKIMDKRLLTVTSCPSCKNKKFVEKLDIDQILSVDALLISSRHLYRMVYSLHEKSGLMSIPINPKKVLQFNKELADPKKGKFSRFTFLEKPQTQDAAQLVDQAFEWHTKQVKEKELFEEKKSDSSISFEVESALPEELFSPCIKKILSGISDGKKRAVFTLINFFKSVGYDYPSIEQKLHAWNKKNSPPLREVYLRGQLHHHKKQSKSILPPNCSNEAYMKDMGVCHPDSFCSRIKNPAQYTKKKAWFASREKKPKKKKVSKD